MARTSATLFCINASIRLIFDLCYFKISRALPLKITAFFGQNLELEKYSIIGFIIDQVLNPLLDRQLFFHL
jgi:hypothetical protein